MNQHEPVRASSVRDLVRRRVGADPDAWHLALVQRDEKWDQVRMRYLLDSLLAGYPIGTLLVCKVTGQSRVVRIADGERITEDAQPDAWQLLDGQQRINTLFSIFTAHGRYGRFYLDMTVPRPPARGPVTGRRARDEGLGYIHWQDANEADQAVPERSRRIDLSRWYDWAEADGGLHLQEVLAALDEPATDLIRILNDLDPDFADEPHGLDLGIARARLAELIRLWSEPSIPVEYRALGSPLDVLEVFTRVNRAGVLVAGQDLFFAAVKTLWGDAEHVVAGTVAALTPRGDGRDWDPLVDRMAALRILARLAARATQEADLVPLAIDRLSGERGGEIIDAMRELADPDEAPLRRMATLMRVIAERSALGFGLYSVDERLWDHVLGWAAVNGSADDPQWLELSIDAIDAYLVGATAFRYASILGDRYARVAMTEALAAGVAGEPFPVDRIPMVARGSIPGLQGGRERVRFLATDDDRLRWADGNVGLLLSILQQIEFRPQRNLFDWDHIYPQGQAYRMWSPGQDGRWRRHHPHRRLVSSAGNLWGLDAGTNRAAQDRLPAEKFAEIRRLTEAGERPVWHTDRWCLTDAEIGIFAEVGSMLEKGEIDPAMEMFRDVTMARALGMVREVLARMPLVASFAGDADVPAADPRPEPSIADALGLDVEPAPVVARVPAATGPTDEKVDRVLARADAFGSGPATRRFVDRARALGLQVRGYKYALTVTPPTTRAIALVAMTPEEAARGTVKTWVAPWIFAEYFPSILADRFDTELGGIRGSFLTAPEIDALGDRLEAVLHSAPAG